MRKRASGGLIGRDVSTMGDDLADAWNRSDKSKETLDRYMAARNAITGSIYNQMDPADQRNMVVRHPDLFPSGTLSRTGRSLDLARADYPGFKRGGRAARLLNRCGYKP